MRRHTVTLLLLPVALAVGSALPAISAGPAPRGIRGEVVSVDPSGESVTVRCRGGVEYQLALGPETGAGKFKVGDPVRARLGADSAQGNAHRVQWTQNPATGQRFGAGSTETAARRRERARQRDGSSDGSPDQERARVGGGSGRGRGPQAARAGGAGGSGRGGGPHRSTPPCGGRGAARR